MIESYPKNCSAKYVNCFAQNSFAFNRHLNSYTGETSLPEFSFLIKTSEFPPGCAKSFEIEGVEIAVFNRAGKYFALGNRCTHTGGPLALGAVNGEAVACPWHGAQFELTAGKPLCAPATQAVPVYTVRVLGDDIEIKL